MNRHNGVEAANATTFNEHSYYYRIQDNPFDPQLEKREHVKWHNDFFDECKRLGRASTTNRLKLKRTSFDLGTTR